jgi:hypothetical protein
MSSAVRLHGQASGLLPSHPTSATPSLLTFKGKTGFFILVFSAFIYLLPAPLHPLLKNTDAKKAMSLK